MLALTISDEKKEQFIRVAGTTARLFDAAIEKTDKQVVQINYLQFLTSSGINLTDIDRIKE